MSATTAAMVNMDTALRIAEEVDDLIETVALTLAIDQNPALQAELRHAGGVDDVAPFSLALEPDRGALQIVAGGGVSAICPTDAPPATLASILTHHEPLRRDLLEAQSRAIPSAVQTIAPFFIADRFPTRKEFTAIRRWTPVIEKQTVRMAALFVTLLEEKRRAVLREEARKTPEPSLLHHYITLIHTVGHLTLISSPSESQAWLSEMAHSFTWVNWTPTFPLVRERTVWLAAAAARSAAAYGPGVIPLYLQALGDARHPTKIFDALLGLVAIACAHDEAFEPISEGIASQHRLSGAVAMVGRQYADFAYQSAELTLKRWAAAEAIPARALDRLGWRTATNEGFATRAALSLDPTDLGTTGEMIGLMILPAIIRAESGRHYPLRARKEDRLLPGRSAMREILHRAWAPGASKITFH